MFTSIFSLWKNYAKLLKIFDIRKFLGNFFLIKMIYSFSNSFQKLSNDEMKADKNDKILAYVRKK
jgi:hypothetical protein